MASGLQRLYVNLLFALVDEHGTIHPPKDNHRREMLMSPAFIRSLRAQVHKDATALSTKRVPLSPRWWRQVGNEAMAKQTEEGGSAKVAPSKRATKKGGTFEVEKILEVRPATGRAGAWVLVRWQGYHASWEAWRISGARGSPLETWEPLCHVRRCEAYAAWEARQVGEGEGSGEEESGGEESETAA